jgi:hypothetical protein
MLSFKEELPPMKSMKLSEVRTFRPEYMKRSNYPTPKKPLSRSSNNTKKSNSKDSRKRSLLWLMINNNPFNTKIRELPTTKEFKSLMPTTSRNELFKILFSDLF